MSVDTMLHAGLEAAAASAIAGGSKGTATAAGSGISDATFLITDSTFVTTASGGGVRLPDKYGIFIVGTDASNSTAVYPHNTSSVINGGSAGAAYSIDAGDGAFFLRLSYEQWIAVGTPNLGSNSTVFDPLRGSERASDPDNPPEGQYVIWMSDGTGTGDDGDILIKITAGGSTKTATLVDFSAV